MMKSRYESFLNEPVINLKCTGPSWRWPKQDWYLGHDNLGELRWVFLRIFSSLSGFGAKDWRSIHQCKCTPSLSIFLREEFRNILLTQKFDSIAIFGFDWSSGCFKCDHLSVQKIWYCSSATDSTIVLLDELNNVTQWHKWIFIQLCEDMLLRFFRQLWFGAASNATCNFICLLITINDVAYRACIDPKQLPKVFVILSIIEGLYDFGLFWQRYAKFYVILI